MGFKRKPYVTIVITSALSILVSACGAKTMYEWDGYSGYLLSYYKHPEELKEFSKELYEGIEKAEKTDNVPPGIYAEYGYTMLELNDIPTALTYFTKERDRWPESKFLMDKVLRKVARMTPQKNIKNLDNKLQNGDRK